MGEGTYQFVVRFPGFIGGGFFPCECQCLQRIPGLQERSGCQNPEDPVQRGKRHPGGPSRPGLVDPADGVDFPPDPCGYRLLFFEGVGLGYCSFGFGGDLSGGGLYGLDHQKAPSVSHGSGTGFWHSLGHGYPFCPHRSVFLEFIFCLPGALLSGERSPPFEPVSRCPDRCHRG